jgi:acetylornithine deacetylase
LVDTGDSTRAAIQQAVAGFADAHEALYIPAVHLGSLPGFETSVVSYTTDIPAFAGSWGKPFLFGPGSIHFAHTDQERIPKDEIIDAIGIYKRLVRQLIHE